VPLWEWTYNSPWHISRYCCSYCFGKWSTCSKGGLPPFPSPHPIMSGYFYYQKWLLYFDGPCHCWLDSHRYGAMNINNDNTCNDNGCLGEDMILRWTNIKWWLHSPCYWNAWVFSFLFWFIPNHLCTDHYRMSLAIFFNPLDVHVPLSTTCVHKPVVCISHNDFSMGCCIWSGFFISSTHRS